MSNSSSRNSTPTGYTPRRVIPPIITNKKDREFLTQLTRYIDREMLKIDENNSEQRYIVHKAAFDKIIDYVTAYKPILTAVKAEYEDCIEAIQRGQREAFYLQGKLSAMAHEPSTLRNYRKRAEELDQKLSVIRRDNVRLQQQLAYLRANREDREQRAKETMEPPKRVIKKDKRHIPGLTLQQSTDLKTLTKELEKLEKQYKEMSISHRTRYSPKEIKDNLKEQLGLKVNMRDHLTDETTLLKAKRHKLKIAVEAAEAYNKLQPPHQTIGDAVVMALAKAGPIHISEKEEGMPRGTSSSTAFEEDDPSKEKEAEMMLEYIEKFNELLEDRKYEEAAIHAANSPKGILRTPETLHRFQDLKNVPHLNGRSPLLAFCDALMSTVLAYGVKPGEYMSYECVKCALTENRLDLLSHWIAQDRLTVSEKLGDLVYNHCQGRNQAMNQCVSIAERIYVEAGTHTKAVECMVRQSRVNQAIEYAQQKAHFDYQSYVGILKRCPASRFANGLFKKKLNGKPLVPLGVVVRTVIEAKKPEVGLNILQECHLSGSQDPRDPSSPIRRAVFDDVYTTEEQWLDIIKVCQEHGYGDVSLELLAAVTVLNVMQNASEKVQSVFKEENETFTEEEDAKTSEQEKKDSSKAGSSQESSQDSSSAGLKFLTARPLLQTIYTESSITSSQTRSSEDSSKTGSSQDSSKTGSTQDSSKTGSTQNSSKTGSTQDSSKTESSQDSSKTGSSQNTSTTQSSEESSKTGSTQDSSKTGSTQDSSQTGSTQDSSQTGSTQESSKTGSTQGSSKTGSTQESSKTGSSKTDSTQESSKTGSTQDSSKMETSQTEGGEESSSDDDASGSSSSGDDADDDDDGETESSSKN